MADFRIPLFKVFASPWSELGPSLKRVMYSGYLTEGTEVADFERGLQEFFGTPNLFATNSCTSALTIALRLSGVKPGSVVLAPPMTCIATVAPAVMLGAKIVWADVDPRTGLMDPESVERLWHTAEAVIAVDWGGDVAPITEIADVLNGTCMSLIEDAAQAFGTPPTEATYRCFSFQAIKHLTTGDGGCVVTQTREQAELGKSLSWFGIDRKNFRLPSGEINWDADIPELGYKANMNNVTAAIGNCQLPHLPALLGKHAANGRLYKRLLADVPEVSIPPRKDGSAYWVFTITCDHRDELMAHLQACGIQASRMHARLDRYSGIPTASETKLPGTDEFAARVLCLPCGSWMGEDEVAFTVGAVKRFYAKRRRT